MRRANDLEQRLVEWGKEYGGGRYEDNGWHGYSALLTLMTYHGPAPQGLNPRNRTDITPADQVEASVVMLAAQQGGWRAANVIRAEYILPGQPVDSKIQKLKRFGVEVSDRSRYSQLLHIARVHVAASLGLPFSEALENNAA